MEVERLRADWAGFEFDTAEFEVAADQMRDCAVACGEVDPRFCDPNHSDFQAPPTFTAKFVSRRILPKGFPKIGRGGFAFDAGKCVTVLAPVRPGDRLVAKSVIHDIYEKTGRSGSMIFIVHRMEFSNQRKEPVSVVDWRMVAKAQASEDGKGQ